MDVAIGKRRQENGACLSARTGQRHHPQRIRALVGGQARDQRERGRRGWQGDQADGGSWRSTARALPYRMAATAIAPPPLRWACLRYSNFSVASM